MHSKGWSGWNMMGKFAILFITLFLLPCLSLAKDYPTKPINLIVSTAAAGSHDMATRMLASPAEKLLGQPFVVINKGEGGGSVALGILARARADGYYLGGCQSFHLTWAPQLRKVTYQLEDFVPVVTFANMPMMIAVNADSGWKTLKDFVEYAKKNPGKITYAVSGVNTMMHIAMRSVENKEGIQWTAMPYPSGNPYIPLLGKHVQATASGPTCLPNVKSGELRVLAVFNSKRWKALPDVPTLRELGYPFSEDSLLCIIAPKATPQAIVNRLQDNFRKVINDEAFVNYIEKMSMEVRYLDSENSMKFLRQSKDSFGRLIKSLNIPTEF